MKVHNISFDILTSDYEVHLHGLLKLVYNMANGCKSTCLLTIHERQNVNFQHKVKRFENLIHTLPTDYHLGCRRSLEEEGFITELPLPPILRCVLKVPMGCQALRVRRGPPGSSSRNQNPNHHSRQSYCYLYLFIFLVANIQLQIAFLKNK